MPDNLANGDMEHALFTINEYVKLVESVGGEDETLIRPLYLGFAAESIQADRVTFYFYDQESDALRPNLTMLYEQGTLIPYDYYSELKDVSIGRNDDLCGCSVSSEDGILCENAAEDPRYKGVVDGIVSFSAGSVICTPLMVRDRCIGILEIANSAESRTLTMSDFAVISIFTSITLITLEKAKLYSWSVTDNLTQLYNYHYLSVNIEKELTRAKRYPKDVGIILMDIDDFKDVNDTYGHPAGNDVLKAVAAGIRNTIRKDVDMPIRYGGDEFLLILPETDLCGTRTLAERLKDAIQNTPVVLEDSKEVSITLSMGVTAAHKDHLLDKDKLLLKADRALYTAKENGKDCIMETE